MKKSYVILFTTIAVLGVSAVIPVTTKLRKDYDQMNTMATLYQISEGQKEIYFAGGCFWGTEKLFQSIHGVVDVQSGYANGRQDIVPNYKIVSTGNSGYRETVRVVYDPKKVDLNQLLKAYFHVIDPTVKNRQGNDRGEQYQTGIYFKDEESADIVRKYAEEEKKKYPVFAVEITDLSNFFPAEEYHQDYLDKNPNGYCHISPSEFSEINNVIGQKDPYVQYEKPLLEDLKSRLSKTQYAVTQNAATEPAFSGEYWDFFEKGIYVDVSTGEPLFSSLDKFKSSCGWPSFSAPIDKSNIDFKADNSLFMKRTEVRSKHGNSHLGHVFFGEPESPNGVRYCINSASLEFIPYEKLEERGYGEYRSLFDKK